MEFLQFISCSFGRAQVWKDFRCGCACPVAAPGGGVHAACLSGCEGEGGTEPAGLRVWLADYPEEGSMALDPDKPWPPADVASPLQDSPQHSKEKQHGNG